jgi:flagellar motility protein MotE (MotC chaperone)
VAIAGAELVTVPILDARFAAFEARIEGRFTSIEASIASAKVWAVCLYAALAITLFGALGGEAAWLVSRQDRVTEQFQARQDKTLEQFLARQDKTLEQFQSRQDQTLEQFQSRQDQTIAQLQARQDKLFEQVQTREDKILEQLHSLSVTVASIQAAMTKQPPPGSRTH